MATKTFAHGQVLDQKASHETRCLVFIGYKSPINSVARAFVVGTFVHPPFVDKVPERDSKLSFSGAAAFYVVAGCFAAGFAMAVLLFPVFGLSWTDALLATGGLAIAAGATRRACVAEARVHAIGEHMAFPEPGHCVVQPRDIRQPAAKHDDVRVEDVDDHREGARHPVAVAIEASPGRRFSALRACGDLGRTHRLARRRGVVPFETRPREERLDASAAPADSARAARAGRPAAQPHPRSGRCSGLLVPWSVAYPSGASIAGFPSIGKC